MDASMNVPLQEKRNFICSRHGCNENQVLVFIYSFIKFQFVPTIKFISLFE